MGARRRDPCEALATHAYDIVLLDFGLPGKDGLDVLRLSRPQSAVAPVLVITARDAIDDRILGLDAGADDYIVKPFDMGELLARMRAVVRRKAGSPHPILSNGRIDLDPATHEVSFDGAPVRLTAREFALLRALLLIARRDPVARRARGPHLRVGRRSRATLSSS